MEEAINAARDFYALVYDPTKKYMTLHKSLNELRTKLCISTSEPLAKLPPCEPAFVPEAKSAVWQVKNWVNARNPQAYLGSVLDHGWERSSVGLAPIMYTGPTSGELISGLFCECALKNGHACEVECPCFLNGLDCIDVCNCGGDIQACQNEKTLFATDRPDTD